MSDHFPPHDTAILSVAELTSDVRNLLEAEFPEVWVGGEVSNLARPRSGHLYLKLKDAESQLNTVIFRGIALRMRFDLADGMEVVARGRISVYVPRGEYQFIVEEVRPKGIGPLELAFRQLKEKLSAKGYFLPERKRRIPQYPRRVCLVTSPTGAAVRDMLEVLRRRWPALEVWVCPVLVQGDGAAQQIADTLTRLNALADEIDVIIVGRGGGSLEDLWPFNEEIVADAVYHSCIPIVSGVGHETDLTITDLVADVRALTPSEAAERVAPQQTEIAEWLLTRQDRLRNLLKQRLELARARLSDLSLRRCFRQPFDDIRGKERQLDDFEERAHRSARRLLQKKNEHLSSLGARLESLSPLNVLRRGYSLSRIGDEKSVVRSIKLVNTGDEMITEVADGHIVSRIESTESGSRTIPSGTDSHDG